MTPRAGARPGRLAGALLALIASLSAASVAMAAELPIEVATVSSPAPRRSTAALEIQTEPGAACTIAVIYPSGPAHEDGLLPQVADEAGRVAWRWIVGSRTSRGRWPIVVTCEKGRDLGRLETSFEVR
jgi:hypothetical protein